MCIYQIDPPFSGPLLGLFVFIFLLIYISGEWYNWMGLPLQFEYHKCLFLYSQKDEYRFQEKREQCE